MAEENRVSAELLEEVRARLMARIAPNVPEGPEQAEALEKAAEAQAAFEAEQGEALAAARRGVRSFSLGSYTVQYGDGDGDRLCPLARALLRNAGLLRRSMPAARRFP